MSILKSLFENSAGGIVDQVASVADRFIETPDERANFALEVKRIAQARDSELEQTLRTELQAKERVLIAELQQDDKYTKRARPTVVYYGLVAITICYVLVPAITLILQGVATTLDLPQEFWMAWGGICGAWVIGRSAEKRGVNHPVVSAITGSSRLDL